MDKKINTEEDAFRNASSTNICFDCQLAIGGCEWSAKFEPVPGWTARKNTVSGIETYHIVACPKFKRDVVKPNRPNIPSYLIEEDLPRKLRPHQRVQCVTTGVVYESVDDASAITGISDSGIRSSCTGRVGSIRGTTWIYLQD